MFNEFKFSPTTKAQIAGRIEQVSLSAFGRSFDAAGTMTSTPASPNYTPKSVSVGLIQNLPWDLVGIITAQYIERAPKPAELFSGGAADATATFDKGNPNLKIEAAQSIEVGLRRATGPFRFEATAYYTRFNGFIFRQLTGNTCDDARRLRHPVRATSTRRSIRRPMPYSGAVNSKASGTSCRSLADFWHRRPVRRRARHIHRRQQRARVSRRVRSAAAFTGVTTHGLRESGSFTPSLKTTSRRSPKLRRRATTTCVLRSVTRGSCQTQTRPVKRNDLRFGRHQSSQPRYPQQRVLHQGPGAVARASALDYLRGSSTEMASFGRKLQKLSLR